MEGGMAGGGRPSTGFYIPQPNRGEEVPAEYGVGSSSSLPGSPRGGEARKNGHRSAAEELREVAETLSRTGKALNAGLGQANEQGQRLRGAISRLERSNEWSTAERKRAEDEISGFFNTIREVLRTKEDEILRDIRGVYAVQDEDNKRRLEELVIQGQKLSKSCLAIQSLNEGTSNATLGSLNTPLNALLEALESSSRILEKEEENVSLEASRAAARGRPATGESLTNGSSATSGTEERGFKFHFCNNQEVQRQIESIDLAQYNSSSPPVVLVGTPDAIEEEARRRKLSKDGEASEFNQFEKSNGNSNRKGSMERGLSRGLEGVRINTDFGSGSSRSQGASPGARQRELFGSQTGMSNFASPRSMSSASDQDASQLKIKAVVPFDDESDNKGVIHFLGSKGEDQDFSNPALFSPDDPFLVVLRASSRIEGDLASLAGYKHQDGAFFETDSALSSWISVELPYLLAPTHYTLGYFINGQDHVPRNWVLQGSKDNQSFHTLRVHENDVSLDGDMHLATWRINADHADAAG
eukprot:CAMPEP_0184545460 /NCGR_PEP_ID=MMETSP0199_2-20130426/4322_1 /TAXON_ID=1112570 /ORGANISM="Thraustochytrium sp., Strain LLF1b" /LENGTH=527 /DNA_ID=CAMNT_0026939759 /DNA_START=89 /DNA_END=1668 /DNA_ORIENTATION=-